MSSVSADDPSLPSTEPREHYDLVLVEDSREYAKAVEAMLQYVPGTTFGLTHFSKLGDALDYVPGRDVSCVLLDLNLPDSKGVASVRAMLGAAPDTPIVVLSGLDDEHVAFEAMHAGAQDYLVKQRADVDLITRSIRYAIERARSEHHRTALIAERAARAEAEATAGTVSRLERLTEAALANLSLDDLLSELLHHVMDMIGADTAAILLLDEERQVLEARATKGLDEDVQARVTIPVGSGFAGRIVSERHSVVIDDVANSDVISPAVRGHVASLVGVPLQVERRIVGVMHVGSTVPRKFTAEDTVVLQLAADRAARAIERAQVYQQEHETAVTLQRSLLPDRLPDVPGLALAARYIPGAAGAEVGGDWYDVIPLADGRVAIAMGDVVGRGIPAASLMGQLRNGLRAYAIEGRSPSQAVEHLDRLLQALNPGRMATLLYLVLDADGRGATFANAGHLPPLIVPPGRPPELVETVRSVPLGVLPYASFEETRISIEPASTLVLYTDGLVEVRGVSLEIRLNDLKAEASTGFVGPNELCEHLLETLLPEGPGSDDVALLAVTTAPASTDRISMTLPAEPEALITARRALRNWLSDVGADPEELYDLTLATGEACTNAIEHAYAPGDATFDVEAVHDLDAVRITVRDSGQWRPPRGQNRGRGLKLMETLMDEVKVDRRDSGTTVELVKKLQPPEGGG